MSSQRGSYSPANVNVLGQRKKRNPWPERAERDALVWHFSRESHSFPMRSPASSGRSPATGRFHLHADGEAAMTRSRCRPDSRGGRRTGVIIGAIGPHAFPPLVKKGVGQTPSTSWIARAAVARNRTAGLFPLVRGRSGEMGQTPSTSQIARADVAPRSKESAKCAWRSSDQFALYTGGCAPPPAPTCSPHSGHGYNDQIDPFRGARR